MRFTRIEIKCKTGVIITTKQFKNRGMIDAEYNRLLTLDSIFDGKVETGFTFQKVA